LKINPEDILKNERWLDIIELKSNLENVEYIIMAAPVDFEKNSHLTHFTLFLNTDDNLPDDIVDMVLKKFADSHKIKDIEKTYNGISKVAFALTEQETPMPILSTNDIDAPFLPMYVIDFTGVSSQYKKTADGYTGWSYIKS